MLFLLTVREEVKKNPAKLLDADCQTLPPKLSKVSFQTPQLAFFNCPLEMAKMIKAWFVSHQLVFTKINLSGIAFKEKN